MRYNYSFKFRGLKMRLTHFTFVLIGVFFGFSAHSATIGKISKGENKLLLVLDPGEHLSWGDQACVTKRNGSLICGTVTGFRGDQPIAEMNEVVQDLKTGSPVMVKSSSKEKDLHQSSPRLGIKIGLNEALVNITGDSSGTLSRTGFAEGITLAFPLSDSIEFQTELGYGEFGYKTDALDPALAVKVTHACLEAELLAKFLLRPVFAVIGFSPAYAISTKAYIGKTEQELASKDIFKPFMLSAVIGVGGSFQVGNHHYLGLDLRYLHGLTNLSPSDGPTSRSAAFFLGTTFWF
jgi:Outer membrane protein beta-barrel domain